MISILFKTDLSFGGRISRLVAASRAAQTDLSCRCLQFVPRHPQIRQSEQGGQLRGVLRQASITHLGKTELKLDHAKRMFNLGADAGFGLLYRMWGPLYGYWHCHV